MVLNTLFNNISVIPWRSVLLVEITTVSGENSRPVTSHWQTYHVMLYLKYTSPWIVLKLTTLVVIGTDCTVSCKSNYQPITTMTAPWYTNIILSLSSNVMLSVMLMPNPLLTYTVVVDMFCSKWTSHCQRCDIVLRNPFSQNKRAIVYIYLL